jgi:hypothetical protein
MKNFVFTLVPLLIIIGCQKELNFTNNIDGSGPNIDGSGPLNIETSLIPSGTFTMGSPISEQLREPDEEQHQVTLSAFRMSKYEISNTLYEAFLNAKGIDSSAIYAAGTYPTEVLI